MRAPNVPSIVALNDRFEKQRRPQHEPPLFEATTLVGHRERALKTERRALGHGVVNNNPDGALPPLSAIFFRPGQVQATVVSRGGGCVVGLDFCWVVLSGRVEGGWLDE